MARNEEKAQSMLYRFREAQAAELGLGTRGDRRPRMASACKKLLREISRKVSKIQDAGLTDYEVRDLNDEINKLMREKRHWENQLVALGGANYRRNVAMLDDDGKEVPGTKGYKYFGRAKDLPGVRELFMSRKNEEEEENRTLAYYKKFMNQGPLTGTEAYTNLREALGLAEDDMTVIIPKPSSTPLTTIDAPNIQHSKRKADDEQEETTSDPKRTKTTTVEVASTATDAASNPAYAHAQAAASYILFLDAESLVAPKMPTRSEMEEVILGLRKKALVEEYFGDEGIQT
ncbi:pre-mRNA-splicing factor ISY1 [Mycena floridula]|nr:pre-mRNA-splicing factor ISY1 [Mycena floridula]